MDVKFRDDDLDRLETDPDFDGGYSQAVVRAFRRRMQHIRAAQDERDLRAVKAFRYEKLKGNRSHQRSIRLNRQWRLIVEVEEGPPKTIVVIGVEDYH